jgi:hypothetical protein
MSRKTWKGGHVYDEKWKRKRKGCWVFSQWSQSDLFFFSNLNAARVKRSWYTPHSAWWRMVIVLLLLLSITLRHTWLTNGFWFTNKTRDWRCFFLGGGGIKHITFNFFWFDSRIALFFIVWIGFSVKHVSSSLVFLIEKKKSGKICLLL